MPLKFGQPYDFTTPTTADVANYVNAALIALLPTGGNTATVASGAAVSLTTATAKTVTSLNLAAGSYLVWGNVDNTLTGATTTAFVAGISLTNNTLPTQAGGSGLGTDPLSSQLVVLTTTTGTHSVDVGMTTLVLTATTTTPVYLVAQATFSAGTVAAYGTIFALAL